MGDRAGKRRLLDVNSTANSRRTVMQPMPFPIRAAAGRDQDVLARLATLDSQRALCGPALIAEIAGQPAAAIDLKAGRVVADPFQATAGLAQHLRLGAAELCGPPRGPGSNRIAAIGALASIGAVMIASQAWAAAPPDLAATTISGAPAALTANASARIDVIVANRGGRAGKATKTDLLLSAD